MDRPRTRSTSSPPSGHVGRPSYVLWSGPAPPGSLCEKAYCENPECTAVRSSAFLVCVGGVLIVFLCDDCSELFLHRFEALPTQRARQVQAARAPRPLSEAMDAEVMRLVEKEGPDGARFRDLTDLLDDSYSDTQVKLSLQRMRSSGRLYRTGRGPGSRYHAPLPLPASTG